jgi:hypothetical protein
MGRVCLGLLTSFLIAAPAAGKAPVTLRLGLVQAQCADSQPCSSLRLARGTIDLTTAKQPAPTCPKRNDVKENAGGRVKLSGVTSGGVGYSGRLYVEVQYKTTFGTDPNGNCSLQGIQIVTPSVLGDVDCVAGRCKGTIYAFACLEKNCADTSITSELVSVTVYDGPTEAVGRKPLATPGTFVAPAAGDAS